MPDTKFCLFWEAEIGAQHCAAGAPPESSPPRSTVCRSRACCGRSFRRHPRVHPLHARWSADAPGKYEAKRAGGGRHGDESPEVRARSRDLLGPYGFLTSHSVGVVIDLMMLFNEHGRLGSLAALGRGGRAA